MDSGDTVTYTRNWDPADPPGATTPAKQIDDRMRNLREDLYQRLITILATGAAGIDIDPLALLDKYSGKQVDRQLIFPASPLLLGDAATIITYDASGETRYKNDATGTPLTYRDFFIPIGYTIKSVECWGRVSSTGGGGKISMRPYAITVSTGAALALAAQVDRASTAIGLLVAPSINHIMTFAEFLRVNLFGQHTQNVGVFCAAVAFRITVDRTDNALSY